MEKDMELVDVERTTNFMEKLLGKPEKHNVVFTPQ